MAADTLTLETIIFCEQPDRVKGAAVPLVLSHAAGKPFGRKCLPKNM